MSPRLDVNPLATTATVYLRADGAQGSPESHDLAVTVQGLNALDYFHYILHLDDNPVPDPPVTDDERKITRFLHELQFHIFRMNLRLLALSRRPADVSAEENRLAETYPHPAQIAALANAVAELSGMRSNVPRETNAGDDVSRETSCDDVPRETIEKPEPAFIDTAALL